MPAVITTVVHDTSGWLGHQAEKALAARAARLEARQRRGRLDKGELLELRRVETSRAEVRALYRAKLRTMLEQPRTPLEVAKLQADELVRDGLGLGCIDARDLLEIRRAWPEWEPGR